MRYASIRSLDISNGEYIGVALFTQGCPFHCKNCFNPETHDFNGGKEYTLEVRDNNIPAIKLYKKFNFDILGRRKKYYNNVNDAIIMTKNF